MTENLQHFRLINGDEVLGDLINNSSSYYYINDPMVIDDWYDQSGGQGGIILNRFCTFSDDNFVAINQNHVVSMVPVSDNVKEYYYQSVKLSTRASSRLFEQLSDAAETIKVSMEPKKPMPFIHKGSTSTH